MKDLKIPQYNQVDPMCQNIKEKVINEIKVRTENAFNHDYFGNGANIESNSDPKTLFRVLLNILEVSSNL